MILMRVNPLQCHWKGWAVEIETFLGPEMTTSEASAILPNSRDFQGPPLPMAVVIDLPNPGGGGK
jgi:hypothetical protein